MTKKQKQFLNFYYRNGCTQEAAEEALARAYTVDTWGMPKRLKKIEEILSSDESKLHIETLESKNKIRKNSKKFERRDEKIRKKTADNDFDKKKAGRKNGYDPKFDNVAKEILALGGHDLDVQAALGISMPTYYRWKRDNPSFYNAVLDGKDYYAVENVESALVKRAMGFEVPYKEIKIDVEGNEVETKEKMKVFAPDTNAAKVVLFNRSPERWREDPSVIRGSSQGGSKTYADIIAELRGDGARAEAE